MTSVFGISPFINQVSKVKRKKEKKHQGSFFFLAFFIVISKLLFFSSDPSRCSIALSFIGCTARIHFTKCCVFLLLLLLFLKLYLNVPLYL